MAALSIYKQHNLLYTEESIPGYRPGGYHPVALGDTFNNDRYKVYHKLGWGGHATAWLAYDTKFADPPPHSLLSRINKRK